MPFDIYGVWKDTNYNDPQGYGTAATGLGATYGRPSANMKAGSTTITDPFTAPDLTGEMGGLNGLGALAKILWGTGSSEAANLGKLAPMRWQSILGGLAALNPANAQQRVDQFRRQASSAASNQGQAAAGALANNGYDPSVMAGINLGLTNQATEAGNQFQAQQYDPQTIANQYMQMLGLSSPQTAAPNMTALQSLLANMQGLNLNQQQVNNQNQSPDFLSQLGSLTGLAGLFGGGGGAGAAASSIAKALPFLF